jgi:hypothetical protein
MKSSKPPLWGIDWTEQKGIDLNVLTRYNNGKRPQRNRVKDFDADLPKWLMTVAEDPDPQDHIPLCVQNVFLNNLY